MVRKDLKTHGTPHEGTASKRVYPQSPHGDFKVNLMGKAKNLFPLDFPKGANFSIFNPT